MPRSAIGVMGVIGVSSSGSGVKRAGAAANGPPALRRWCHVFKKKTPVLLEKMGSNTWLCVWPINDKSFHLRLSLFSSHSLRIEASNPLQCLQQTNLSCPCQRRRHNDRRHRFSPQVAERCKENFLQSKMLSFNHSLSTFEQHQVSGSWRMNSACADSEQCVPKLYAPRMAKDGPWFATPRMYCQSKYNNLRTRLKWC